jgi:hypothetical protein
MPKSKKGSRKTDPAEDTQKTLRARLRLASRQGSQRGSGKLADAKRADDVGVIAQPDPSVGLCAEASANSWFGLSFWSLEDAVIPGLPMLYGVDITETAFHGSRTSHSPPIVSPGR